MAFSKAETNDATVLSESAPASTTSDCHIRSDDSGLWNACLAWYLLFIHLLASIALVICVINLDGLEFKVGAPPFFFNVGSGLYQAQVTGLISLGLILVRFIAGSSSTLLAWRIIFILLEKRGISLAEMTNLISFRAPIWPASISRKSIACCLWATVAILLLWPQGFAAPLASSSVSWIPGVRVQGESKSMVTTTVNGTADYPLMLFSPGGRMRSVVGAAAMISRDPAYAFRPPQIVSRRYFNTTELIPNESVMDMTVPYIAVDLRWINASSDSGSQNAGNFLYQDPDQDFAIRKEGAIGVIRDKPWDADKAVPTGATTFVGKKLVAIKLQTLIYGDKLADGSLANKNTPCPVVSDVFGQLPNVDQHRTFVTDGKEDIAFDCYIFSEATITAGTILGKNCTVVASAGSADRYTTCYMQRNDSAVEKNWLTGLALDFTSEVLKYAVMQNYTQPWICNDLHDYTKGLLTLGYQTAWSGLMFYLGTPSEPTRFWPSEPIVSASVESTKLYAWLGMNITLTVAAILVLIAQSLSKTKTIRDSSLAALTIDMTEASHGTRANGLCNAATLNKQDRKLPLLRWSDERAVLRLEDAASSRSCCRQIAFVDDEDSSNIRHRHGHSKRR